MESCQQGPEYIFRKGYVGEIYLLVITFNTTTMVNVLFLCENLQANPFISQVVPCQVLIGHEKDRRCPEMTNVFNKKDFIDLLKRIEEKSEDPMVFIQNKLYGSHISGNHRYDIKNRYLLKNEDTFKKFHDKPYWYLTLTQIYIGLRPEQARYEFVLNIYLLKREK